MRGVGAGHACDGGPEQGRCFGTLTLRQSQPREPGLRVLAELRGTRERVLGGVEIAPQHRELAELVPSVPEMREIPTLEFAHRVVDLCLGVAPTTLHARDLGTMQAAVAGVAGHACASAARQRLLGPLRCAASVAERLAETDRVAVDARGSEGGQATRHCVGHRLIDEAHPACDVSSAHEDRAGADEPHRDDVGIAALTADADGLVVVGGGGIDVVVLLEREHRTQHGEQSERRARLALFEQALGLCDPPDRDGHAMTVGVVHAELDRLLCRGGTVACGHERGEGSLA